MPDIEPNAGVGKAIKQLRDSVLGSALAHTIREASAVVTLLLKMGEMVASQDISGLQKTDEGKLATYLLYGAAHERSLTWHFESRGMRPRVVQLHAVAERQYIDTVQAPNYNNHGRRLGHAALRSLTYGFLKIEAARSITEESYEHLEFLNSSNAEERLSFLVRCALARREEGRDPDEAFRQYNSILRSFMPSPHKSIV